MSIQHGPNRRSGAILLLTVAAVVGAPRALAAQPTGAQGDERVSVLVHLEPGADRGPIRAFCGRQGGRVQYEYTILPDLINVRNIPAAALAALERIPGVRRVEPDGLVEAHLNDSTPLVRGLQSQITAAGISATGAGVRVCILDTGIDSDHLMYADRIDTAAGRDFFNGDANPEDDNGHGSHVAGTAVGRTGLTVDFGCVGAEPFQGLAPLATLIGVKVLGATGSGTISSVVAGIDYGANQTASGGRCDVINMSLGLGTFSGTCDGDTLASAANNAANAGVVVVASSGNSAASGVSSPACGSNVIAVGATYDDTFPNCEFPTQSSFTFCTAVNTGGSCIQTCTDSAPVVDQITCFSNRGSKLDVVAPGCVTFSADIASPSSIVGYCGTSQAAPHVSGLAALLLGVDPSLTPAEVRQLIRDGAVDLGPPGFDPAYGYGRIDVIDSLSLIATTCGNGTCDPSETSCTCSADCGAPPSTETVCTDGRDNDCDGRIDCGDYKCSADPACQPRCGDGVCNGSETCSTCAADCPSVSAASCGDGLCEAANGEDCLNCPGDCRGVQGGPPSGRYCCGQGGSCIDSRCTTSGFSCTQQPVVPTCCGDGACQGAETSDECGTDCAASVGEIAPLLRVGLDPGGDIVFSWSASCAAADDYAIYEGVLGDFTSHVPRLCSTAGMTSVHLSPAAGDVYYLVVPNNHFREGSHGLMNPPAERARGAVSCMGQELGTCP